MVIICCIASAAAMLLSRWRCAAVADADDAGVTTVTLGILGADLLKQLVGHILLRDV